MTEFKDRIHAEVAENLADPAWRLALEIFIGELMQQSATYHQAQIQAMADRAVTGQLNRAKVAVAKHYLIERLSEIRKDSAPKRDWTKEPFWVRDEHGRFSRYVGPPHLKSRAWLDAQGQRLAERQIGVQGENVRAVLAENLAMVPITEKDKPWTALGILNNPVELRDDVPQSTHRTDVAALNEKLVNELSRRTGNPADKQRVQFLIVSPDGYKRIVTPAAGQLPRVQYDKGERVDFMTPVGPDNPVSVAGKAVNIGMVAGASPEDAAQRGAVVQDMQTMLSSQEWGRKLQATANALKNITNNNPTAVQAAAVAEMFNLLGPDAARAFGGKFRQLTYRYSGQEARPEQYSEVARKGKQESESIRGYENRLGYDLASTLPTRTAYNASLKAGSTPPSKGYILNKQGRVVSEAVGFSDDWYTPFNLKRLPNLKDGSYVRTRAYGGITPEDVRLAMRTGAKRVTVVSNNGTFTMEFEPRALQWGHRFGYGGNAMIRRYTKALDAVQFGAIRNEDEVGQNLQLNARGYRAAMADLRMKYPYFIMAPSAQMPDWSPPSELPLRSREADSQDLGYIRPTGTHAIGAHAGFHDDKFRELYTNRNGSYAYDDVQRYRVGLDLLNGAASTLGVSTRVAQPNVTPVVTGNQPRPTGVSVNGGVSEGNVQTARAYSGPVNLRTDTIDLALQQVRKGIQVLTRTDPKLLAEIKVSQAAGPVYQALFPENTSQDYKSFQDYKDIREQLRTEPSFRQEFWDDMSELLIDAPGVDNERLLAVFGGRSSAETPTETRQENEGGSVSDTVTTAADISTAQLRESTAVQGWLREQARLAQQGDERARAKVQDYRLVSMLLNQKEEAAQENRPFKFSSEDDEKKFNALTREFAARMEHARVQSEDPVNDDGSTTTGGPVTTVRLNLKDALDTSIDPIDVAGMHVAELRQGGRRVTDSDFDNAYQQLVSSYRHTASGWRKTGRTSDANRLDAVAASIDDLIDQLRDEQGGYERFNR